MSFHCWASGVRSLSSFLYNPVLSFGEGNGNPLQYSCLGNLMDRAAWQAMVHRVAETWTRLKQLSTHMLSFSQLHFSTFSCSCGEYWGRLGVQGEQSLSHNLFRFLKLSCLVLQLDQLGYSLGLQKIHPSDYPYSGLMQPGLETVLLLKKPKSNIYVLWRNFQQLAFLFLSKWQHELVAGGTHIQSQ